MLIELFNVQLSDLMPLKGVAITLPGDSSPYRISESLHQSLRSYAQENSLQFGHVVTELRDEINKAGKQK